MGSGFAAFLLAVLALVSPRPDARPDTRINAVIGDASWTGTADAESASEGDRIRSHLTFVLDRLRRADASSLAREPRRLRAKALDDLERYVEQGRFPRRTKDAYLGHRPRFVDDRGVWCAVGQLIVDSGELALAKRLGAEHEYDYVLDIDDSALNAWATAHGFSARELAMIQPQYGFELDFEPLPAEPFVARYLDEYTVACANESMPAAVKLYFPTVTTTNDDAFSLCFAVKLRNVMPRRIAASVVEVRPPWIRSLLEKALAGDASTPCLPQPGPIPKTLSYRVQTTKAGIDVTAASDPRNSLFEQCFVDTVRTSLKPFTAVRWDVTLDRKVTPVAWAATTLPGQFPNMLTDAATACFHQGAPRSVTATARAGVDDREFAIQVDAKSSAFDSCVAKHLRTSLRNHFTVPRPPSFRIDSPIHVSATVAPVSPEEVRRRTERLRRARERERYEIGQ